jgi:hypothetical protein
VAGTVDGNGSQSQPGIYLNHSMVCFRAFGPHIVFGASPEEAGFGQSALPAGASLTPPPSALPMPAAAPVQAPPVPVPLPTQVMPNPQFLQVPAPPAPPMVAPPPASGPQMTAKAGGVSREAYIQGGWTDAQLIANGLMTV